MTQKLFEYLREEHGLLLLDSELADIVSIVSPRAYPCTIDDCATEAEVQFAMYLTGYDRETIMGIHRTFKNEKQ